MQQFEISAEARTDVGKGASRRLRRTGKLPGIVYGTEKGAQAVSLVHNEILRQLDHEAFFSHILTLKVDGKSENVVLKDLQRHPYKPVILHIDFQRIDENEELTMRVPIHFLNEAKCVGVKTGGGVISHTMTEVEVSCLPKYLPEFIGVDIAEMNVGDTVHVGELQLPEGVQFEHGVDVHQPVVSVHLPRAIEEEEAEAPEAVEGVAPAAEAEGAAAEGETPASGED